ncbi:MAG: FtsQ-type POTRA domain-containing protein [Acidobacteriota bacterium]
MTKKTTNRKTSTGTRGNTKRRSAPRSKPKRSTGRGAGFVLPLFLSFCILVCLSALGFLGYRTVTASTFFNVTAVEVVGTERSSKADIEKIIVAQTERSGVWNADLAELKARIEKLPFVKSAAVSRVLPNGLRISVFEREPLVVVRLAGGDFLVDGEARILARAEKEEPGMPFFMTGWDEEKSEKADRENLERVKMYGKMLVEWKEFDLAARVTAVNLSDLREPRAVTQDSGAAVSIGVGRDNFAEHLRRGIGAIVGKGETFEAVDLVGSNMILAPRKSQ